MLPVNAVKATKPPLQQARSFPFETRDTIHMRPTVGQKYHVVWRLGKLPYLRLHVAYLTYITLGFLGPFLCRWEALHIGSHASDRLGLEAAIRVQYSYYAGTDKSRTSVNISREETTSLRMISALFRPLTDTDYGHSPWRRTLDSVRHASYVPSTHKIHNLGSVMDVLVQVDGDEAVFD
jgi:hypothetical protein